MATKIEWCDEVWNPVVGCTKCSPGCDNCYAERFAKRLKAMGHRKYQDVVDENGWTGRIYLDDAELQKPLHWRNPRRVFVCSMGDLFHPGVPFEFVAKVMDVAAKCIGKSKKQSVFQFLTKRPGRLLEFYRWANKPEIRDVPFPDNFWFGVTVCNQREADEKIPTLLQVPAAVRFVSIEPMLGEIDLNQDYFEGKFWGDMLHWVIVGGESGPKARPMHPNWVRSIRDQCKAAGVPFFFKQWGEYGTTWARLGEGTPVFKMFESQEQWVNKASSWLKKGDVCVDMTGKILTRGRDFAEAEYPVAILSLLGKKKAGYLLDGKEYREFPK